MASASPVTEIMQGPDTATTRLSGPWAWLARLLVGNIWLLGLAILIQAIPHSLVQFTKPCDATAPNAYCDLGLLTASELASLPQLGFTVTSWSWLWGGLNLFTYGLWLLAAGLIIFRRSNDWMALLMALMLIGFGLISAAPIPDEPWATIQNTIRVVGGSLTLVVLLIFPNGRFAPRWTWGILILWLAFFVYSSTALYLTDIAPRWFQIASVALLLTGVGSQIYRYVRVSTPVQRQQTKLIVISLSALPIGDLLIRGLIFPLIFPVAHQYGLQRIVYMLITGIPLAQLSFTIFPVAVVFSVLRYRLWDIDFVINRTLVYGLLTVILGGAFAGLFFAARAILSAVIGTQNDLIAAVIPAVAVTAVFNPARKLLRTSIDRWLYGIKLDYVEAVKAYGGTKRESRKTGETRDSFGGYTGLTLLGKGGMGEVYLAQHPTLNRSVAIKILPEHKGGDEAEKRFEREAQTIAKLKHSNIVTLHDVGEQDGQPYMVMEYIDGQDLSDVLRQRDRLPLAEALPILNDVAAALDYAHTQGVIHRDIKPSNVMVEKTTATGAKQGVKAVLMDFGIAKSYATATRLTHSGGMIGTLDYISPEQIQGAAEVDARADIYSFGVMVYQVLTGKLPFAHNNPGAMVLAHLNQPPPDPRESVSDLPDSVAIAVMRAMSKKPDQRFDTAGAFVAAMA